MLGKWDYKADFLKLVHIPERINDTVAKKKKKEFEKSDYLDCVIYLQF